MPSDLERAIAKYREDLLANESRATIAIANAYKATRARLVKRIDDLADSIAEEGAEFTPSQVLKWQRAKTLLRQVETEMATLATASNEPIQQAQMTAVEMAGEQAKGLAVATAQDAGADAIAATIDTTWNRLNTGAAEAMVGRMSDGSPLNTWLDQFGKKASGILAESLQSAAALGTNPRAVARELAKQLDISAARLLLTSRTEILNAQRSATLQNYRENADIVDGWIWISAHQTRTCLACLSLDGSFFDLSVEFQAAHVSCRCSSRASVKGVDMTKRGIRTGEEWFNVQPEAVRRAMIPKGLWDEYERGAIVLSDFRYLHDDEQWGPSFREATIPQARANAKRRERSGSVPTPITLNSSVIAAQQVRPVINTRKDAESYFKSIGVEIDGLGGNKEIWQRVANAYADELSIGSAVPPKIKFKAGKSRTGLASYTRSNDATTGQLTDEFITITTNSKFWDDPEGKLAELKASGFFSGDDPNHPMIHEFGHYLHAKVFTEDRWGYTFTVNGRTFSQKSFDEPGSSATAKKVSRYGATSPHEFVAEAYAAMRAGTVFDDDVMDLYRLYGGPEVKQSEDRNRKAS